MNIFTLSLSNKKGEKIPGAYYIYFKKDTKIKKRNYYKSKNKSLKN
jgi:hypothetical protein